MSAIGFSTVFALTLVFTSVSQSMPIPDARQTEGRTESMENLIHYLVMYGHMRTLTQNVSDESTIRKSIISLQRFAGLPVTGKIDSATDELIATPRCGVPDVDLTTRRKRFVIKGSKWQKRNLTYLFQNYTSKLPKDITRKIFTDALKLWSDASTVTFSESTSPPADIKIRFARRYHGDSASFDGRGGILAHAFYPSSGETHFDEDEPWTHGTKSGVNLMQVSTHELGHTLGLAHSKEPEAVMAPYYKGYTPKVVLHRDDIEGIHSIYGKPAKNPSKSDEDSPPKRTSDSPVSSSTPSTSKTTFDSSSRGIVSSLPRRKSSTATSSNSQSSISTSRRPPITSSFPPQRSSTSDTKSSLRSSSATPSSTSAIPLTTPNSKTNSSTSGANSTHLTSSTAFSQPSRRSETTSISTSPSISTTSKPSSQTSTKSGSLRRTSLTAAISSRQRPAVTSNSISQASLENSRSDTSSGSVPVSVTTTTTIRSSENGGVE